eukprot:GHVQ01027032.1.p1 GENE.GHVQ01027032.1~~GHVQ01027032.1.p1  ORF type:complete len:380 (-),score=27.66 GHVQ01027032.1:79-1218(-)
MSRGKTKARHLITEYHVLLVTCAVTRAVHLEVLRTMETKEILWALRRFVAVRGKPERIISDNALQFLLLGKITGKSTSSEAAKDRAPPVKEFIIDQSIQWESIPCLAPWMGGFYERLVGLTKKALFKGLWHRMVTIREFEVIVTDVMCFLNNRPLTVVCSEEELLRPVSPADFLKVGSISPPRSPNQVGGAEDADTVIGNRIVRAWQRSHGYAEAVWTHWFRRYLTELREYHVRRKRRKKEANWTPAVSDVVLVDDLPPIPRNREACRLAVVTKLHHIPRDGEIRSVEIRTQGMTVVRPIQRLYPVECPGRRITEGDPTDVKQGPVSPQRPVAASRCSLGQQQSRLSCQRRSRRDNWDDWEETDDENGKEADEGWRGLC